MLYKEIQHYPLSTLKSRSHKNLTLNEVLSISNAAGKSQYFDRKVEWLQSALSLAKDEKKRKIIEKKIQESKQRHDKAFEVISKAGTFTEASHLYWTQNKGSAHHSTPHIIKKITKMEFSKRI